MDNLDYIIAQLIDHFHLTPREIGQLTREQIRHLYCWKRDEYGTLEPPLIDAKQAKQVKPTISKEAHRQFLLTHLKGMGAPVKQSANHT